MNHIKKPEVNHLNPNSLSFACEYRVEKNERTKTSSKNREKNLSNNKKK